MPIRHQQDDVEVLLLRFAPVDVTLIAIIRATARLRLVWVPSPRRTNSLQNGHELRTRPHLFGILPVLPAAPGQPSTFFRSQTCDPKGAGSRRRVVETDLVQSSLRSSERARTARAPRVLPRLPEQPLTRGNGAASIDTKHQPHSLAATDDPPPGRRTISSSVILHGPGTTMPETGQHTVSPLDTRHRAPRSVDYSPWDAWTPLP
jgi:hypothetical protein